MDKLVESLLSIERSGHESLAELEKEHAAHARLTEAEIARCLQDIQQKTNQVVEALKRESEAVLKDELAMIEGEFLQKTVSLRELFDTNAEAWRKELFDRVLHIS